MNSYPTTADTPPAGRPPSPDGSLPPHAQPPKVASAPEAECFPSGAGMSATLDQVRGVIRSEWVRLRGGVPMDANLEMRLLNELMTAMSTGKVIPGFKKDASGQCTMNWAELACFGRWYALLDEEQRAWTMDSLADGIREPWSQGGEYPWPPAPAACTPSSAESEAAWCAQHSETGQCHNLWCCPEEVYNDPVYTSKGSSKGSNDKWMIALGGLLFAGVVGLLILERRPAIAPK